MSFTLGVINTASIRPTNFPPTVASPPWRERFCHSSSVVEGTGVYLRAETSWSEGLILVLRFQKRACA